MNSKDKQVKKTTLGRGLSSLLSNSINSTDKIKEQDKTQKNIKNEKVMNKNQSGNYIQIPIDDILLNPYQPRQSISDESLKELVDSIKACGVIVPIIVVISKDKPDKYILVAGERRLQASKKAGLKFIPAIVKNLNDQEIAELALIENIHRENLNPIEEAFAYLKLIQEFNLSIENIANKLGKSTTYVDNKIKLTRLPKLIQNSILIGEITEGHGRVLASLNSDEAIIAAFKVVVRDKLNVKRTEELVRDIKALGDRRIKGLGYHRTVEWLNQFSYVRDNLKEFLGSEVRLKRHKGEGGSLIINFQNDAELDNIYRKIKGETNN